MPFMKSRLSRCIVGDSITAIERCSLLARNWPTVSFKSGVYLENEYGTVY